MLMLFLLRFGLTIGDCRTARGLARGFDATDFRVGFLDESIELVGAEYVSPFMSVGELVEPELTPSNMI